MSSRCTEPSLSTSSQGKQHCHTHTHARTHAQQLFIYTFVTIKIKFSTMIGQYLGGEGGVVGPYRTWHLGAQCDMCEGVTV